MSADLFSNFIGMTLQATGNNNNAWGTILNGSALQTIEKAIAGNVAHAVTGGTLDLSASPPPAAQTQVLEMFQAFTGVLTANQVVKVPNLSKFWLFANQTTGAFQLLIQTPSGTQINIPQGTTKFVVCDGSNNLIRIDKDQVGNFEFNTVVNPGALECSGQSLLKTDFPDLYGKIGTTYGTVDGLHFTLPLLTDTGRFLRSRAGAVTAGTYQASQNKSHTHTGSGTTSGVSAFHTHAGSGTTSATSAGANHQHSNSLPVPGGGTTWNSISGSSSSTTSPYPSTGFTNTDHTHSYSFTTGTDSVDHTHTYSFTTSTGSADGTEARPEALSVVISIRY